MEKPSTADWAARKPKEKNPHTPALPLRMTCRLASGGRQGQLEAPVRWKAATCRTTFAVCILTSWSSSETMSDPMSESRSCKTALTVVGAFELVWRAHKVFRHGLWLQRMSAIHGQSLIACKTWNHAMFVWLVYHDPIHNTKQNYGEPRFTHTPFP